jgi:hypothetical protein
MAKRYKHVDMERERTLRHLEVRGVDISKSFITNMPTANLKKLLAANMQMNDETGTRRTQFDV